MKAMRCLTFDDKPFHTHLESSTTPERSSDIRQQQVEALLPTLRIMKNQMTAATILLTVILGNESDVEGARGRNQSVASDYGVQFEKKWLS